MKKYFYGAYQKIPEQSTYKIQNLHFMDWTDSWWFSAPVISRIFFLIKLIFCSRDLVKALVELLVKREDKKWKFPFFKVFNCW